MRTFLTIVTLLASTATALVAQSEVVQLGGPWRFSPVDDPSFADPRFDASSWATIAPGASWERQGFDTLDGHVWYRVTFVLPHRLRTAAVINEGLRLELGPVDDIDQTFLNGALIGLNGTTIAPGIDPDRGSLAPLGSKWNTPRAYDLPFDDPRLRWDAENVLAIRVYDGGGPGGLWSGVPRLRALTVRDLASFTYDVGSFQSVGDSLEKSLTLSNHARHLTLTGTIIIRTLNGTDGTELLRNTYAFSLAPGADTRITYRLTRPAHSTEVEYVAAFDGHAESIAARDGVPYILTPPPPRTPRINGPLVVGARPGRPFVYRIPVSGEHPMLFDIQGLPSGLRFDRRSGIISGRTSRRGVHALEIHVQNAHGHDERIVTLNIGDKLALTPPMGWNSWNVWGLAVDQDKVIASARVFDQQGLADHGWAYINIDDGWEIEGSDPRPKRTPDGTIVVNEKFPDMKALGDSLHALGLKFGIYSSPGPLTCGGYTASYGYEQNDALSYAAWGIDYLKYDWCSYGRIAKDASRAELMKPYAHMRRMLDEVDRDIVYSLCQYGMGDVWEWGAEVGGDLWRTTGDITDSWESMSGIGFDQVANAAYAGPGHWNDPDMLVVGWVGWGPRLRPTRLTPDEQYTHISLWCLLSAPLLIGCDLTRLDAFTLNLLTNDEVLAIDQDPLGRQATPRLVRDSIQIWTKPLANGSTAVGVFNLSSAARRVQFDLNEVGLPANVAFRDLWRQRPAGSFSRVAAFDVPRHGVVLLRTIDR